MQNTLLSATAYVYSRFHDPTLKESLGNQPHVMHLPSHEIIVYRRFLQQEIVSSGKVQNGHT